MPDPVGRSMAYDDMKDFDGRAYSGMPVGGEHTWIYPNGLWRERKLAPEEWEFTFDSLKERERESPEGSGVPPGTQYHWYLLAHQRVRKIDKDSYATHMAGMKFKVAHKRPYWRKWSCEYEGQRSEGERVISILEDVLARLRAEASGVQPFQLYVASPADLRDVLRR